VLRGGDIYDCVLEAARVCEIPAVAESHRSLNEAEEGSSHDEE